VGLFVVRGGSLRVRPNRRLQKNGSALFRFLGVHNNLLCSGGRVFQTLQLFAGFESHSLAWRNADFFAGAGIAADAGLAGFHAEDAEFAEFDPLAAAERALQRLKNGFDGLFGFSSADVGFGHDRVHDVELDHTPSRYSVGQMLEVATQVVKTYGLIYTG